MRVLKAQRRITDTIRVLGDAYIVPEMWLGIMQREMWGWRNRVQVQGDRTGRHHAGGSLPLDL